MQRELTLSQQLAYAVPQLAQALAMAMMVQWLAYFYIPPSGDKRISLIGGGVFAALMLAGRLIDAVTDPLIGYWSDNTRSTIGRRRPFMLWGTPILAISFLAIFFPPSNAAGILNSLWLGGWLFIFWSSFTAVVAPYSALLPEITYSSQARVRLSTLSGLFMLIGMACAASMIGPWQSAFPHGIKIAGIHIQNGIQMGAIITAVSLFLFWIPVISIRENYQLPQRAPKRGIVQETKFVFNNSIFQSFVRMTALSQITLTMIMTALPYLCTQLLERDAGVSGWVSKGEGEAWVGYLMGITVCATVASFPLITRLQHHRGKKHTILLTSIFLGVLSFILAFIPSMEEPALGMVIFCLLLGFPTAGTLLLTNPIYADIVDDDSAKSGLRREGLYNGAMAVVNKTAIGMATALVIIMVGFSPLNFTHAGLVMIGPVAGLCSLLGAFLFRTYPITT